MKRLLLFAAFMALLVSCGDQHKAESRVKDFLDENLKAEEYTVSFSKMGSTNNVTDSVMDAMLSRARSNKAYKNGIKLDNSIRHDTLIYIRGEIVQHGKDTLVQTFYLSPDMEHVVAFK